MVKIMDLNRTLYSSPYARGTNLNYYVDMDEQTVRSDLQTMLNDLFELEIASGDDMSLEERLKAKREMASLTRRIDIKRSILRRIEAKTVTPALPTPEEVSPVSWLSIALTGALVASLYWGHSHKVDLEELHQSYNGLLETHEIQVKKHNDLVQWANSLSFENSDLYDENGKLKVANTDLEKTKEKLTEENAIAWRWYDRHTEKIEKLEEQVIVLTEEITQSETSISAVASKPKPKWDYCVTQSVGGRSIYCRSGRTKSEYKLSIDQPLARGSIYDGAVVRIEYDTQKFSVVGSDKTGTVLGIYLLDNDGTPERVKDLRR
jgi:hypothetical protein